MNAMGTLLLVSPVVHPWYLLWVLPFVVLYESQAVPILRTLHCMVMHNLFSLLAQGQL